MTATKRNREADDDRCVGDVGIAPIGPVPVTRLVKRIRTTGPGDRLSPLSDELLVRILGHLPLTALLAVAPVSQRFHRLADDAQLWRALYLERWEGAAERRRKGRGLTNRNIRGQVQDIDWKRQYRLRHNWARGQCAVEEFQIGSADNHGDQPRMLVKVADGMAVTANCYQGLQVWELKTRSLVVERRWGARDKPDSDIPTTTIPTALSVHATTHGLDIAVGRLDGGFDIWHFDRATSSLYHRFAHAASSNGPLVGIAYVHPLVLTATQVVLVSLYAWEWENTNSSNDTSGLSSLSPPILVTSLLSHTAHPPLALSIRRLPSVTIASIAYTFSALQGWAIGIQDLHVANSGRPGPLRVTATRLAFSPPRPDHSPLRSPSRTLGPTALSYTHPYLLATLPDNTLVLHLCTSSASSLVLSSGIRLWGHTSGISDAEITARGKAVSVSVRGDEMRVWELEGRPAAERGRSVTIRPSASNDAGSDSDRRNSVGFDDKMVIVLKESPVSGESLMVYDFT